MDTQQDNYNISFFKPTTELARKNAKFSIVLILIWAVAIFGFQLLLKILEKPTPESAYTAFESVWEKVQSKTATTEEYQVFIKSALSVLGKLSVSDNDMNILNRGVTDAIFKISNEEETIVLKEKMNAFNSLKDINISDEKYLKAKKEFSETGAEIINVEPYSIEAKLLPFTVKEFDDPAYNNEEFEASMKKYLIHNQSFLTDARFLGFPFHYFYTAVFLLILFVGLCWIFCIRTDKVYKNLNIEERV